MFALAGFGLDRATRRSTFQQTLLLTMTVQFGDQMRSPSSSSFAAATKSNQTAPSPSLLDTILIAAVTIFPLGGWNEISRRRVAVHACNAISVWVCLTWPATFGNWEDPRAVSIPVPKELQF